MKITAGVCRRILNAMPMKPPEIGGILGSSDGIISRYQLDDGRNSGCGCFYSPDVTRLNTTIKAWQREEIAFRGIFHTHFFGVCTLSEGDIRYINTIMECMPSSIEHLYFPLVVLPEKQIVPFIAVRNGRTIEITKDELVIV